MDDDSDSHDDDDVSRVVGGFVWNNELRDVETGLFTHRKGPILVDLDLTYESQPIEYVELFLTPDFF